MPLTAYSSDVLHKCHQIFPCSGLWHSGVKFTCWGLSHHFSYIMLYTHCLLPSPSPAQPFLFSQLFLCAIKYLHCLSPVALLSTFHFSAILFNSRTGQEQSVSSEECKGNYIFFSCFFFLSWIICWPFLFFLSFFFFFFWLLQGTRQSSCSCVDVPSSGNGDVAK